MVITFPSSEEGGRRELGKWSSLQIVTWWSYPLNGTVAIGSTLNADQRNSGAESPLRVMSFGLIETICWIVFETILK